ncbi:hypothetical protein L3V23_01840 [Vibrio sp. A1-b2]|uniref:hypothetical protein n=1 Tax=Vibrio sp. A1-b2 TaxID=2912248 RepID=UPI001F3C9E23|nr:hypothetical protein [Vibrio sp. A1-b2]MCF7360838.1 hypothetical protein [Vibrio sp. A1-b2]
MINGFLLITVRLALSISKSTVFSGGTLGGNPSADSGAVNVSVSVGKCTQYKMDVKAAQQKGKDVASITVPEGCDAIKEK